MDFVKYFKVDLNKQDEKGFTQLHRLASRNISESVALYLANTNCVMKNTRKEEI